MDQSVSEPGIKVTKRRERHRKSAKSIKQVVTKDWTVAEIVGMYPICADVLAEWGIHCVGCAVGGVETLSEAGQMHGMSEEDVELLLNDMNEAIANTPERPQTLTITKDAALAIKEIAKKEGASTRASSRGTDPDASTSSASASSTRSLSTAQHDMEWGLSVVSEEAGKFAMEFREKKAEEEKEFFCEDVPEIKVWATASTLEHIGGAQISFSNGNFSLEVAKKCCQDEGDECRCTTGSNK